MKNTDMTTAITLGAMTGLRTMAGPLCASNLDRHGLLARARIPIFALTLLESLADKALPLPARSSPLPLLGRAATGAALGYFVGERRSVGRAILGAAAAMASATLAAKARGIATKKLEVPDFLVGLLEDVVLAGVGRVLVGRAEHRR